MDSDDEGLRDEGCQEVECKVKRIVQVFCGKGQMQDSWFEGRLWVYEDGDCAFVFLSQEPEVMIGPAAGGAWADEDGEIALIVDFTRWKLEE